MERIRKVTRHSRRFGDRLFHSGDPKEDNTQLITHIKREIKSFTWTIENFCVCPLKVQEYLESRVFYTGISEVTSWCLRFYPHGRKASVKNTVGLFLCKISPSTRNIVTVELSSKILADGVVPSYNKANHVCEEPEEIGTDDFIRFSLIQGRGTLKFSCRMEVGYLERMGAIGNDITGSCNPNCSCTLSDDFRELYESGKFTDAVLKVDEKVFPVHKTVLAARSTVFAAMFEHDMQESETNTVLINNIDSSDVSSVLQHVYTGKISHMTVEKAIQLYPVSDMYELFQLKSECTNFMLANLSVDNVCRISILADLYSAPELKSATDYIFRNYSAQIFEKKEWKKLCQKKPHLASKIMSIVVSDFKTKCTTPKSK